MAARSGGPHTCWWAGNSSPAYQWQASQASGSCASVYPSETQEAVPVDVAIVKDIPHGGTIVKLSGELDVASAPDLRERLLIILDRHAPSRFILDLSALSFIDSSGIAVLVNTERRARLLGCTLELAAPQAAVWRVLQVCGLQHHFVISESISMPGEEIVTGSGCADP